MTTSLFMCPRCGAQNTTTYAGPCPTCLWLAREKSKSPEPSLPIPNVTEIDSGRDRHIHLTLRGSKLKQKFFHQMVLNFDRDWPFKPKTSLLCKICGGGVYKKPRFVPSQLKLLARQINELPGTQGNLKVKIKSYAPAKACFDLAREMKFKG